MLRQQNLATHLLAASAAGLLGIGLIGQVLAQEDDAPPPAQQNAENQNDDADDAQDNNQQADPTAQPQDNAEGTQGDAEENRNQQNAPENNAQNDNDADDAPPSDDLNFDDETRTDTDPPAAPSDGQPQDDRNNDLRGDIRRDDVRRDDTRRNDARSADAIIEDGVSPSDRQFGNRDDARSDVRRFNYDDPSQPIPQQQAQSYQGHGCDPCGRRVYHNPCGGCGSHSVSHSGQGYHHSNSATQGYQTQSQQPNRAVLGVTLHDERDYVRVSSIVPGSPAEQAGIEVGDHIVAIDDTDVRDAQGIMGHLRGQQAGGEVALTIERDGEQHQMHAQLDSYTKVFGNNRQGSQVASNVPAPPQDRLAQRGEPRTAFRPNYDEADNDKQRLERVQLRIGQLENELTALRKEEQDLQNSSDEEKNVESQSADDVSGETEEDATRPTETPTPAEESNQPADAGDDLIDSNESKLDRDAAPKSNRERLVPSAR